MKCRIHTAFAIWNLVCSHDLYIILLNSQDIELISGIYDICIISMWRWLYTRKYYIILSKSWDADMISAKCLNYKDFSVLCCLCGNDYYIILKTSREKENILCMLVFLYDILSTHTIMISSYQKSWAIELISVKFLTHIDLRSLAPEAGISGMDK